MEKPCLRKYGIGVKYTDIGHSEIQQRTGAIFKF